MWRHLLSLNALCNRLTFPLRSPFKATRCQALMILYRWLNLIMSKLIAAKNATMLSGAVIEQRCGRHACRLHTVVIITCAIVIILYNNIFIIPYNILLFFFFFFSPLFFSSSFFLFLYIIYYKLLYYFCCVK